MEVDVSATPAASVLTATLDLSVRSVSVARVGVRNPRGLERESGCNFKSTFYPCTFFRQPRPLPQGALRCRYPADDCIVYYRAGGVTRDNFIVYDFYALAARWTVHAKIYNCRISPYL